MGWNDKSIHIIMKAIKKPEVVADAPKPEKPKRVKKPADAETKTPAEGENE